MESTLQLFRVSAEPAYLPVQRRDQTSAAAVRRPPLARVLLVMPWEYARRAASAWSLRATIDICTLASGLGLATGAFLLAVGCFLRWTMPTDYYRPVFWPMMASALRLGSWLSGGGIACLLTAVVAGRRLKAAVPFQLITREVVANLAPADGLVRGSERPESGGAALLRVPAASSEAAIEQALVRPSANTCSASEPGAQAGPD